ncbi:hypothetical protein VHA01S_004_00330 [Vibrio halioticoli NBRC 102217]|uniref:Sel1 repeat family protein n=1 Tax=Vibrio halioticoli NBRC 102217 TaxID=1219072 RepID=V5EZK9_9VIBR|nr:SEL1-like repeat protein [Vibrio halioticoli]GAD88259.1 hypothetical protein VHA01S_004_00330 [Vibrio halioticoli NBRC 102217]
MNSKFLYNKGYKLLSDAVSSSEKSEAVKYLFQSSTLKYPEAIYAFGRLHLDGELVKLDRKVGIQYLKDAESKNVLAATFELALTSYEAATSSNLALEYYRKIKKLAELGYEPAILWINDDLISLSKCYLRGHKLFPSKPKAKALVIQAVNEQLITNIAELEEHILNFDDFTPSFYQAIENLKIELTPYDELVDIADKYFNSPSSYIRDKAFNIYKLAVEKSDSFGLLGMARCYEEGVGCQINDNEANRLYQILADNDEIAEAALKLAVRIDEGIGVSKMSGSSAFYYFCKAASLDNSEAAFRAFEMLESENPPIDEVIDLFYYESYYDEFDISEYERVKLCLLSLSCDEQNAEAHYSFAQAINELLEDTKIANSHYKIAANLGHPSASYEHALNIREQHPKDAHHYLLKAAKGGIQAAFKQIAWNLYKGEVCIEDKDQAEFWFKKSALSGNVHSMYVLGFCYLYHHNTEEYDSAAVLWLKKATEKGSSSACYELGRCYQNGWGVDLNYLKAREHYKKAQDDNPEQVAERLKELEQLVWDFYQEYST